MLKTTRTLLEVDSSGNIEPEYQFDPLVMKIPISEYNCELTVPSNKPRQNADIIRIVEFGVIIPILYESTVVHSDGKLNIGNK